MKFISIMVRRYSRYGRRRRYRRGRRGFPRSVEMYTHQDVRGWMAKAADHAKWLIDKIPYNVSWHGPHEHSFIPNAVAAAAGYAGPNLFHLAQAAYHYHRGGPRRRFRNPRVVHRY